MSILSSLKKYNPYYIVKESFRKSLSRQVMFEELQKMKETIIKEGGFQTALDTHFDAASGQVDALDDYFPESIGPNLELDYTSRRVMIGRCRETRDNDALGGAIVDRKVAGAVGTIGFIAKPSIDNDIAELTPENKKKLERAFAKAWIRWIKKENCDIKGERSFTEMLKVIANGKLTDGDVLVNTLGKNFNGEEFNLKIQIIEGERVSNPGMSVDIAPIEADPERGIEEQNGIIQGIEVNYYLRHQAYHVRETHPGGDGTFSHGKEFSWFRLPVYGEKSGFRRAFFIKRWGREGRFRGLPILARVLPKIRAIKQYSMFELMAAAVQSLYTVFVRNINPGEDAGHNFNNNAQGNKTKARLGSGTIQYLFDNQDVTMADPSRPNSNYGPFNNEQVKQVAYATGYPVDYVTLTFNQSYTAARAAFLQATDENISERYEIINDCVYGIYNLLIMEILIKGYDEGIVDIERFLYDARYRNAICGVNFVGSKLGSIDELKDVQSAGLRIDKGLSTFGKEISQMTGTESFQDIVEELAEQLETRRKLGIIELQTPGVVQAKKPLDVPIEREEEKGESNDDEI